MVLGTNPVRPGSRLAGGLAFTGAAVVAYLLISIGTSGSVGSPNAAWESSAWLVGWAAAISRLAEPPIAIVLALGLAALLAALRHWHLLAALFAAVAGNGVLNWCLKQLEARSRPLAGGLSEGTFAFPSAHTSGTTVVCAFLVYVAAVCLPHGWRALVAGLAAAASFAVGASRVVLGAHHPADVAGGAASGLAWIGVVVVAVELVAWSKGRRAS